MTDLPYLRLVKQCRSCGAGLLPILSLGSTPLANSLLPPEGGVATQYPLDLLRCPECSLVQLEQVISPAALFSDYVYFSSVSDALVDHARGFVEQLTAREQLGSRSLVIEIASNDGYLLQFVKRHGVPVLGIEPAANIAQVARDRTQIPTLTRFFTKDLADELAAQGQHADAVIGNNVLAHVPELNDFVAGVAGILKPSGTAVFEVPYLKDLLDNVEFDTIYHEHQCYYSLTALEAVFQRHGLSVWAVNRIPIHGGSLRVWVAPEGRRQPDISVDTLLGEEAAWGVASAKPYRQFADAVASLKSRLMALLGQLQDRGAHIAAYGAAAKGVTLTSYCGIGRKHIDFVVDRSPHKQGMRFPVDALAIEPPSALLQRHPEYTLMLTWNFAAEILRQQAEYTAQGGKFIIPVPDPRVVGGA